MAALQLQINFRIVFDIQCFLGDIVIVGNGAAAHRGGPPVHVHIEGGRHIANNGKGLAAHHIQRIRIIVHRNGHDFSQVAVVVAESVRKAFIRPLRHPSALKIHLVHRFGHGVEPVNGVLLRVACGRDQIHIGNPFRCLHTLQFGKLLHIFFCPSVVADGPQIEHVLPVHKLLARCDHVRLGHQQTHKHRRPQRDDGGDGYVSSKGFDNGLAQILAHGVSFHYHSISEISCGCSFRVVETTVPFFTRITLSAIEVRALLWVMMITVMPVFLPVSWSSLRMALPV